MADEVPQTSESHLQLRLRRVERDFQLVQHTKFTRVPLAKEVADGGLVVARISGTTFIYTKFGEQLSRVAMTDV